MQTHAHIHTDADTDTETYLRTPAHPLASPSAFLMLFFFRACLVASRARKKGKSACVSLLSPSPSSSVATGDGEGGGRCRVSACPPVPLLLMAFGFRRWYRLRAGTSFLLKGERRKTERGKHKNEKRSQHSVPCSRCVVALSPCLRCSRGCARVYARAIFCELVCH